VTNIATSTVFGMFLVRIWTGTISITTDNSRGFPQSLHVNAGIVPKINTRLLPSLTSPIHVLGLFILISGAM